MVKTVSELIVELQKVEAEGGGNLPTKLYSRNADNEGMYDLDEDVYGLEVNTNYVLIA